MSDNRKIRRRQRCPECKPPHWHSFTQKRPRRLYCQVGRMSGAVISWRVKLSGSNIFWKNALAGLQEAVFLEPNAPRSVFLWRLGCNASRKIRHAGSCEADLAKLVAPKFFRPALSAFAANHFCHCHQQKLSILPRFADRMRSWHQRIFSLLFVNDA